jgi:alpha-ribazole phosphatase
MTQEYENNIGQSPSSEGDSPIFVERKLGQSPERKLGQSPAKRLVLVRHGRILAEHVGKLIGSTDVPLDPASEVQARAMAGRVIRWAPQVCFCSPMQRCWQTAAAIAPHLTPHIDADLREIDFGRWETRSFAEAAAQDPSVVDCWAEFRSDFSFPGGERIADFLARVAAAAGRLIRADAETVLAVAHGGVIRAMICQLLGLEARKDVALRVPYSATVVIDVFDGQGVLAALEPPETVEGNHG